MNVFKSLNIVIIHQGGKIRSKILFSPYMKASEPQWVNPNDIQYGVNPLRLGGLQIILIFLKTIYEILKGAFFILKNISKFTPEISLGIEICLDISE